MQLYAVFVAACSGSMLLLLPLLPPLLCCCKWCCPAPLCLSSSTEACAGAWSRSSPLHACYRALRQRRLLASASVRSSRPISRSPWRRAACRRAAAVRACPRGRCPLGPFRRATPRPTTARSCRAGAAAIRSAARFRKHAVALLAFGTSGKSNRGKNSHKSTPKDRRRSLVDSGENLSNESLSKKKRGV